MNKSRKQKVRRSFFGRCIKNIQFLTFSINPLLLYDLFIATKSQSRSFFTTQQYGDFLSRSSLDVDGEEFKFHFVSMSQESIANKVVELFIWKCISKESINRFDDIHPSHVEGLCLLSSNSSAIALWAKWRISCDCRTIVT